jgi:outer membrane PBP1 activator LpoA protein
LSETNSVSGVSGKLYLDEHNRIRRELDWVQLKNGAPTPL